MPAIKIKMVVVSPGFVEAEDMKEKEGDGKGSGRRRKGEAEDKAK